MNEPITTNEMTLDAGKRLDEKYEELHTLMLNIYANIDKKLRCEFMKDDECWLKYVSTNLSIFRTFYEGGSERSLLVYIRWTELIEARISDLKKMCEQFMIEVDDE